MNDPHPTVEDLAGYVTGTLDPPGPARLEAHVASCAACARALAQEARLEVALHAVARARSPARRSRAARAVLGASAVAIAVGIAAAAPPFRGRPAPAGPVRIVCGAEDDLRRCRAAASCAGLLPEDAPSAADVPIYETLDPTCAVTPALGPASERRPGSL